MKFTSEDLLKAMGLKIGDVIKTSVGDIFEIVEDNFIYLRLKNDEGRATNWQPSYFKPSYLINLEFEILPPVKKIGDMKCEDFVKCKGCPFTLDNPAPNVCITSRAGNGNKTFKKIVESTQKELDDIKLRLDEEVEE